MEMYNPYHEADINKFVSVLESRMQAKSDESKLARLRAYAGLTQKALAERSGVSVRMIEQYEQGKQSVVQRLENSGWCVADKPKTEQ